MKTNRLRIPLLSLLLFAATFALFSPSLSFELVNFDDPVFITHNPILFNGFSWAAIRSAFTGLHGDETMYVPLLWVSYLLDLKFLGASPVNPWGFHFTNVLFHALNSVLFFLLLFSFCRKPWRAFFFAAIWALHPRRVESVAWVTERKDVLSAFFALLCMGAYGRAWVRRTGAGTEPNLRTRLNRPLYLAAFLFFIFGLLVKPMLVTIPCLLLLLDVWPLRRMELAWPSAGRSAPRLILEKLPFFLCAAIASLAVYSTQTHAISSVPLKARLLWIPANYLFYLETFFFPFRLFPMVPRGLLFIHTFLLAIGVLAATSVWIWAHRRKNPNELVGWLAFLGLLFPVIGIVWIGVYPVADRYSYLPSMGLSLALLNVLASRRRSSPERLFRSARASLAVFILAGLAVLTIRLLPIWRNNKSLYDHVARQSPEHYGAINYQARREFFIHGDVAAADRLADRLLQLQPTVSFGQTIKILCLSQLQSADAAWEFAQAHYPPHDNVSNPGDYESYLAILAFLTQHHEEARRYMDETLRLGVFEPKSREQLHALAMLLAHEQDDEATALAHASQIESLRGKTRLAPEDFFVSYTTLWDRGFFAQALPFFRELVRTYPARPDLLNNIAWLLATTAGSPADPEEILQMVRQALEGAPNHPVILDTLSVAQANAGDFNAALQTATQLAAGLALSPANDAPHMLRGVQKRIALFQKREPYREYSSNRLLYAP